VGTSRPAIAPNAAGRSRFAVEGVEVPFNHLEFHLKRRDGSFSGFAQVVHHGSTDQSELDREVHSESRLHRQAQERSVITRVTRGTVSRNSEARVFEILREATRANPKAPGLVSVSISRQVKGDVVELLAVTIWEDLDSMAATIGPNWREPTWLPGLAEAIETGSLEILETVLSSYDELAAIRSPPNSG
jgi:hypothetical protein